MNLRGLIDRITNRDVVEGLEANIVGLENDIEKYDATIERMVVEIEEKDSLIQEKEVALQEFEEKAETLTGTIRVLKMRFDTIFPSSQIEREVHERGSKQN